MTKPAGRFTTERTRRFRAGQLTERDERTITNIETFGCEIVQVKRTGAGPGWSYTVGVYDICRKPEVIAVGLYENTAQFLLNEAAKRLRDGVNLLEGRHRDMVGEVECEFRPADPKWVKHLMGWALWYYEGSEIPVIQAVYPDRENRFLKILSLTKSSDSRCYNLIDRSRESKATYGHRQTLPAAYSIGSSPSRRISLCFYRRPSTLGLKRSLMFRTTWRMARGSSWVTVWPARESLF